MNNFGLDGCAAPHGCTAIESGPPRASREKPDQAPDSLPHLDHTGYLPALVRDGFRGRIHATHGTTELSRLVLCDSGRLLEEQAEFAHRHGSSRHRQPKPLYTEADAEAALTHFTGHPFDEDVHLGDVLVRFLAGGTRGAALQRGERSLRIFGRDVPIRAEVHDLQMLSAHADGGQLIDWMGTAPTAPHAVYLTHGEPAAADALRVRIRRSLGWSARVPEFGETVTVGDSAMT